MGDVSIIHSKIMLIEIVITLKSAESGNYPLPTHLSTKSYPSPGMYMFLVRARKSSVAFIEHVCI